MATAQRASHEIPRSRSPGPSPCGRAQSRCLVLRGLVIALVAMTSWTGAHATESTPASPSPQQQLRNALSEVVAKHPRHVGALYVSARTAASMGDETSAIQWLDRLAEVGMEDELDPDDFGAFADTRRIVSAPRGLPPGRRPSDTLSSTARPGAPDSCPKAPPGMRSEASCSCRVAVDARWWPWTRKVAVAT